MLRKIIKIDEDKCNGCGACAAACHEGAIEMIEGKARLTREDYCDGLGDCLPACPVDAISFEEREAPAYDETAVLKAKEQKANIVQEAAVQMESQLSNWPVQIKLAPLQTVVFANADLLIAADCTAYAYANFHQEFIRGRVTLIGCPKLDAVDYAEKLTQILQGNEIQSVTVLRMQVPCCGGLESAVKRAIEKSGKELPLKIVIVAPNGKIIG